VSGLSLLEKGTEQRKEKGTEQLRSKVYALRGVARDPRDEKVQSTVAKQRKNKEQLFHY
jgi:hypothetical protein